VASVGHGGIKDLTAQYRERADPGTRGAGNQG